MLWERIQKEYKESTTLELKKKHSVSLLPGSEPNTTDVTFQGLSLKKSGNPF